MSHAVGAVGLLAILGGFMPIPWSPPPGQLDVALCVNVGADAMPTLEAVRVAAARLVDAIAVGGSSVRVGLVLYGAGSGPANTRLYPFTQRRDDWRVLLGELVPRPTAAEPGSLRHALTRTLDGTELGGWRRAAVRVVVVVGADTAEEEVGDLDALARQAGIRVFPAVLPGVTQVASRAFAALAGRTGGVVGALTSMPDLIGRLARIVESGLTYLEPGRPADGRVVEVMGGAFEIALTPGAASPGDDVVVFSRELPGLAIARAAITAAAGDRFVVSATANFADEPVRVGCPVRVARD